MAKRVTIGEVAADAGVSAATVSRVLNGGAVTEETASRVWAAVRRLDYTPNALTRSVFAGRSSTIGVVMRDLSSPFFLDLIRGIDDVAAANGSLVMFANTFRQRDHETALIQMMDEHRVRGLIVTTGDRTDTRIRRMAEGGTPCVVVARRFVNPPAGLHTIRLDDAAAGALMAGHLAGRGRTSIGVVTSGDRPAQRERVAGLRRCLAEHGLALPGEAVASAETEREAERSVAALLDGARGRGTPLDAIVCTTGRLTVAVHTALTGRGLTIPDDIAFLTTDDFPWATALGLSVITQPSYEMGRRAAELVVDNPGGSADVVFEPDLVPRGSTDLGRASR
ncbi:LacI family transcriptional regulator [Frankia sp. CcI49]|uniref:LacI family DNA-binding transcriptional regulator n=1 Tax=Frankia sp. CcI49 TaxID=1745382 RepID=UPI000978CC7A|nr:LacI family DNA-binding transcriptional regulator [Frankia sp. CcI49]ONH50058.1 LacI family transcriptional regulator [Frankia sp. CcI49]